MKKRFYTGLDSGILPKTDFSNGKIKSIPSTGYIGRSFVNRGYSLLFFTDPLFDLRSNTLTDKSIAESIYEQEESLNILNIACGGCSDMPLFEKLLSESIGVANPKIEIINADLSDIVLDAVKSSKFPHFYIYNSEVEYSKIIDNYVAANFESGEDVEIANEFTKNINTVEYFMLPEVVQRLKLEKADILDLPYEDETFDIVIAHYVLSYLASDETKAKEECSRVLKDHGFFTSGYMYQKDKSKLNRIVGRKENIKGLLNDIDYYEGITPIPNVGRKNARDNFYAPKEFSNITNCDLYYR